MTPAVNPADDFLAAHGLASQGNPQANLDALLEQKPAATPASVTPAENPPSTAARSPSPAGGGGNQPADLTQQSTPTQVSSPGVPLGMRILNEFGRAAQQYGGDVTGSFGQLRDDWLKSVKLDPSVAQQPFWQRLQSEVQQKVAAGQTMVDAFKAVTSPIGAAFDVGTTEASRAIGKVAGLSDDETARLKTDLDNAAIAVAPEKGGLARFGKAAELAAGKEIQPVGGVPPSTASRSPSPAGGGGEHDFIFAGREALRPTAEDKNMAADYLAGKIPDNPVQASLDTLSANGSEVAKKVAAFIPPNAIRSDDALRQLAYAQQRTPDQILAGLKTALPNDPETLSWKMTADAASQEYFKLVKAWQDEPTPENYDAISRGFALALRTIQSWEEAGTVQGRALRARQLTAEATPEHIQAVQQILRSDNVEDAIRRTAALQDPEKIPGWLSLINRATSRDSLVAGWTDLLLSNVPKTLSKKLFGDGFAAAWQSATHGISELTGALPGGSTGQLLYGYWASLGDGLRAAGKALRLGGSQFHAEYQTVEGIEKQRLGELAKGMSQADQPTSGAIALLRAALPTDWIGAADDFAKVIHYRAELRRLSWAKAGGDPAKISELMDVPPPALHEQALAYALHNSYQEPLPGVLKDLQNGVDRMNWHIPGTGIDAPFGRFILPFVKVPSNLVRYAYGASPMPAFAPSPAFQAELAAGGARASLAKASVALGSAVAGIGATLAYNDRLTGMGPSDPDERRFWLAGHQPYSVKLGDTWYGFGGLHPLGMILGAIGDTTDVFRFAHNRDAEDAAASLAFGVAHALLEPTFMVGLGDFLEAVNDPTADGRRWLENLGSEFLSPQGGVAIDNATDQWRRAHYNLKEAIEARTPGLSKNLPPARTIWGDPIPRAKGWMPWGNGGALGRAISPVAMRGEKDLEQPIDKWIYDNRAAFPHDADQGRLGLTPPGQIQSFSGGQVSTQVQLNAQQLDRLRVLAGNALKDPVTKMGAKDTLNALVAGNYPIAVRQQQWNDGSPEARAVMVQRYWGQFRDAAKKHLLAEDGNLRDAVTGGLKQRAQKLTQPTTGGP